jgi:hypothetical protein
MKHALILGLVCSTLSACAMRMEARPDEMPPPPPFVPPSMSYEEAVQLGSRYASDRGYGYRLQEAHLIDGRYWAVNFRIFEHERPGRLHLEYDAFSRQLLNADARLGRGHGEDDDHEDDAEHGHHHRRGWERDD